MGTSPELVWLIQRMRTTPSRRGRLRLVVEGWETLRGLSPTDRLLVARELGIDGAERLVEEIAKRRGSSTEEILGALGLSDETETTGVGDLMRGLAEPASRKSTIDRLLDAASAWVADLDTLKGEEQQTTQDRTTASMESAEPPLDVDGDDVELAEKDDAIAEFLPPVPALDEEKETSVGASEEPAEQPDGEAVALEATGGDSRAELVEVEGDGEEEGPEATETAEPPDTPDEPDTEARPMEVVETVDVEEWESPPPPPRLEMDLSTILAGLKAKRSLCRRLGELARALPGLGGAGVGELHTLLESFPDGWARRRALETMLRSGLPIGLPEALELVHSLEGSTDRMWGLTTLAETRELGAADRESLLEAAGTPAIRRRLTHRLRR